MLGWLRRWFHYRVKGRRYAEAWRRERAVLWTVKLEAERWANSYPAKSRAWRSWDRVRAMAHAALMRSTAGLRIKGE